MSTCIPTHISSVQALKRRRIHSLCKVTVAPLQAASDKYTYGCHIQGIFKTHRCQYTFFSIVGANIACCVTIYNIYVNRGVFSFLLFGFVAGVGGYFTSFCEGAV